MSGLGKMTVEAARRLLSVGPECDAEGLRSARNKAMMSAHPDHGGSASRLNLVIEAHRVLEIWLAGGDVAHGDPDARLEISPAMAVNGGRQVITTSDGRRLAVTLPAGLRAGDKVGAGGEHFTVAISGGAALFVSGDDLCMQVNASASLLANGGKVRIKTPAGACIVWIPPQTGSNRIVRVLGRGPAAPRQAPARGAGHQAGAGQGRQSRRRQDQTQALGHSLSLQPILHAR